MEEEQTGNSRWSVAAWFTTPRLITMGVLLAIFVVSILIRLPYIDRPMGLHHDEGTARTLVHAEAWEEGPTSAGYLLRTTLNSPGDKFLSSAADDEGNLYYYSFPPGHPLWAFLALRAVGVEPTVMSVRVFNLLLGFLSAIMIYLIVREMLSKLPEGWSRFAGGTAFTVYVFSPIVLWYQSNAYTSASAVQPLFIGGILAATLAYRGDTWRRYGSVALGALTFLMCYTEWLGFAFAAVVAVFALFKRKDRTLRVLAIAAASGAAVAAVLLVAQYASQLGFVGLAEHFLNRYELRSGLQGNGGPTFWIAASWERLARYYAQALLPLILGVISLMVWDGLASRGMPKSFKAGEAPARVVFTLAIAPVLLHHVVLFNHTVIHDFDNLKSAVFLSILFGYLVGRLLARYARKEDGSLTRVYAVFSIVVVVVAGLSFALFAAVNSYVYPQTESLGRVIAEETTPDEVVFIDSSTYIPPSILTHYAGRNWTVWPANPGKTRDRLSAGGDRTGVLFVLDDQLVAQVVAYVSADGFVYDTRAEARSTLEDEE